MCLNLYKLTNGMNVSLLAMASGRIGLRLDEVFPGFMDIFTYDEEYPHTDQYDVLVMVKREKGRQCVISSDKDCKCTTCQLRKLMTQHSWVRAIRVQSNHAMVLIQYTKEQRNKSDQEIGDNMLELFDPKHAEKFKAEVGAYERTKKP